MEFKRTARFPSQTALFIKAAKALGLITKAAVGIGLWRSLKPIGEDYVDFYGPFPVIRGKSGGFTQEDGTEVFMVDDTSGVEFTFAAEP